MFLSIASFSSAMLGGVSQGILWGIMALGVYITFKILDFADMTVDGSFALGGCTCAILLCNGWNPLLCLLISFLVGMVAGLLTGVLHTKLKIPGILAGILMMLALYSINLRIMGGPNKNLQIIVTDAAGKIIEKRPVITIMNQLNDLFHLKEVFKDNATNISSLIAGIIFSVVIIMALYWFFGTELGSAIRATGDNEKMARAQGVNTDSMKILALMLANGLVSLSGGLICQQQRFGDVSMGIGAIVIGLASIIIGEVIFGHRFKFWYYLMGVLLGSVIYRIIIAIVLQLGMKSQDMKLFTAIIVALALSVPVFKSMIFKKKVVTPEVEVKESTAD